MISFESDYNNGCTPEILRRLADTNDDRTSGYGSDPYCQSAIRRIREAVQMTDADVFFLTGGTQTNATVIDSLLMGCEAVITVETGHIAVHEEGTEKLKPTIKLKVDDGEIAVLPFIICLF